jgi:hypothetical protein
VWISQEAKPKLIARQEDGERIWVWSFNRSLAVQFFNNLEEVEIYQLNLMRL